MRDDLRKDFGIATIYEEAPEGLHVHRALISGTADNYTVIEEWCVGIVVPSILLSTRRREERVIASQNMAPINHITWRSSQPKGCARDN